GDTIWLRGGTYVGRFDSRLAGTASQPIIVRNYNNERVILDGYRAGNPDEAILLVGGGGHTWFWGLEVMNSDTLRQTSQDGSWPTDTTGCNGVEIDQNGPTITGIKF